MLNPDIIPFSPNETQSWQQEIANNFKDSRELLQYLHISDKNQTVLHDSKPFPLRVTRFYANLIKKGDINDPLLIQVLPLNKENHSHPDYQTDAVGDLNAIQHPGLIHKYHGRALLSLTQACGIHCRYCFRRHFPYSDNIPDLSANSPIMKYLASHQEIHEIILSGGDPLMLSDQKLHAIIKQINRITHIKTLRFHTRIPSILPSRINQSLITTLQKSHQHIVMVLHINHAQEINTTVQHTCQQLKQHGITLLNQSVLLKGVNHTASALSQLSFALFNAGILPYYLHRLDKTTGTAHFDLSRKNAKLLMRELKKQLPGYLVPRLVEEIQGEASKTHIF